MPQLDSYTDLSDPLNQRIMKILSPGRPGGTVSFLHVGGHPNLSGARLTEGNEYPFTALGRLGLRVPSTQEERVIEQLQNRYNRYTGNHSTAQLVLLDTNDQDLVEQALRRDARRTSFDDPYQGNDDVRWLAKNRTEAERHISKKEFSFEVNFRLARLRSQNPQLFQQIFQWIAWQDPGQPRIGHHDAKGATRLRNHYTNLRSGLDRKQGITEARGEYAAAKILITVMQEHYQMKMGKAGDGGRPNGIDQIWVKRDPYTGTVNEYLIVEAKGSINAHLGHPQDGQQMSPRWLFTRLVQMAAGHGSFIDDDTNRRLPRKILEAMFDDTRTVLVRGIVFHALYGTTNENQVVQMTDLGTYNQPEAVTQARANVDIFSGPSQSGLSLQTLW